MPRLADIVAHPARYEDVARAGQRAYLDALSPAGGEHFAKRLRAMLKS